MCQFDAARRPPRGGRDVPEQPNTQGSQQADQRGTRHRNHQTYLQNLTHTTGTRHRNHQTYLQNLTHTTAPPDPPRPAGAATTNRQRTANRGQKIRGPYNPFNPQLGCLGCSILCSCVSCFPAETLQPLLPLFAPFVPFVVYLPPTVLLCSCISCFPAWLSPWLFLVVPGCSSETALSARAGCDIVQMEEMTTQEG